MKSKEKTWEKCSNKKLQEGLSACPEVIEMIRNHPSASSSNWIDVYDIILSNYNMSFGTNPVYKGNTNVVLYFDYHFWIDGEETPIQKCKENKTLADAQLCAVHDTMYKLRERIRAKKRLE